MSDNFSRNLSFLAKQSKGILRPRCHNELEVAAEKEKDEMTSFVPPLANKNEECSGMVSAYSTSRSYFDEGVWLIDSGASTHMCHERARFKSIDFSRTGKVRIADGSSVDICGYGEVIIEINSDGVNHSLLLKRVAFIPDLAMNLMAVRRIAEKGFSVLFLGKKCFVQKNDVRFELGRLVDNCYHLNELKPHRASVCVHQWHRLLAHRNLRDIRSQPNIEITKCSCKTECEGCIRGKLPHLPFPKVSQKPENCLDVIVSDLVTMPVESYGRSRYFVTFIDVR